MHPAGVPELAPRSIACVRSHWLIRASCTPAGVLKTRGGFPVASRAFADAHAAQPPATFHEPSGFTTTRGRASLGVLLSGSLPPRCDKQGLRGERNPSSFTLRPPFTSIRALRIEKSRAALWVKFQLSSKWTCDGEFRLANGLRNEGLSVQVGGRIISYGAQYNAKEILLYI
jgi:hypothetical protein